MKKCTLSLLLLCLFSAATLGDGPETGTITGTVIDAVNTPLPGVQVEMEGQRGTQTVFTDEQGVFRFGLLPPGRYKITTTLEGFNTVEQLANVTAGSRSEFELHLILATEESITVTAEAPMIDKYNVTAGARIDAETIGEISATVRSFYGALQILPGVTNDVESMDLSQSRPTVNGAFWQESNVYVDGVDATYSMRGGGTRVFLPSSALAEVSLEAGGGGAEYGRNVGSHTNLITKSGTNKFHGDLAGVYASNSWNENYKPQPALARDERLVTSFILDGLSPAEAETAAAEFIVFGPGERNGDGTNVEASIGGPIQRDKAWFFVSRGETSTNQLDKLLDGTILNNSSELQATIVKLNYQPGAKHMFAATWIDSPVDRIFLLPAMADRYTATFFDLSGDVTSLTWNYSAKSNLFLETKLARQVSDENRRRPFPPELKYADPDFLSDPGLGPHSPNNNDHSYVARIDNTWNNGWIFERGYGLNEFPRDQFNLAATHFAMPNHEFKYGIDLQKVEWNQDVQRPNIYSGFELKLGTEFGFSNGCQGLASDPSQGGLDTRCFLVDYNPPDMVAAGKGSGQSDGRNYGAYVRDRISFGDHWLFNLGLRVEDQLLENDRGRDVISDTSLSPRITAVYDFAGDGKRLLTASTGRFFVQTPQDLVNSYLQEDWNGASNAFDLWLHLPELEVAPGFFINICPFVPDPRNPATTLAAEDYCFPLGSVRPGGLWRAQDAGLIDVDIEPYHRDEVVLGYEHQLNSNWALDAKAIWWRVDNLIGNTLQRDADFNLFRLVENYKDYPTILRSLNFVENFVANGLGTAEQAEAVLDGFTDDHRRYQGLQLQMNRRHSKGWALYNNLTISKVEGKTYGGGDGDNDLGAFSNLDDDYGRNLELILTEQILSFIDCEGQNLPTTCIEDLRAHLGEPLSTIFRHGDLPIDRPIILKSYGYKLWNWKDRSFSFGGLFVWQSGSPWQKTRSTTLAEVADAGPFPGVPTLQNAINTGINTFMVPRGSFDNEDFWWLNLTGAFTFPLGYKGLSAQIRSEISNITNEQSQVATSSRTGFPLRSRRSFQQPRKYRLLGSIRF